MNIPKPYVPMLLGAVRDAVLYNEQLLTSETLRNRDDYEEHLVHLTQFLEYLKEEYKSKEDEYGLKLEQVIPE
ncbi:hypothetical protein ACFSJ3_18010 [Corallincola platygyrae]|uniref:Uncharacterized protein n=1 Tax=Corallincola platygyrae TaxID=1193278 RepID=A0ABW4XTQ5_9GAMM